MARFTFGNLPKGNPSKQSKRTVDQHTRMVIRCSQEASTRQRARNGGRMPSLPKLNLPPLEEDES